MTSEFPDTPRLLRRPDIDLAVYESGQGRPVILSHGFPELAFSWRHQLAALAGAGYHALVPDQRGYGRSGSPPAVEDYDIMHLTDDLVALLDDTGEEKAVFVGHDWGAMVVWQLALLHPERVAGVVGMSVPFLPRAAAPPTSVMRQLFADSFFYILYFQAPGVADAELSADPAKTMRRMLAGLGGEIDPSAFANDGRGFVERLPEPDGLPAWLSQEELDRYVAAFRQTGFTGGLNWYRNLDRNWTLTPQLQAKKVKVPSLFIGGSRDPVLVMSPPSVMDGWLEDHRDTVLVDGAGHWVQQERPDVVNEAILQFVHAVHPPSQGPSK